MIDVQLLTPVSAYVSSRYSRHWELDVLIWQYLGLSLVKDIAIMRNSDNVSLKQWVWSSKKDIVNEVSTKQVGR